MNVKISTLKKKTHSAIKELLDFFEDDPTYFESESDVRCYLYHLLLSKKIPYYLILSERKTNKKYIKDSGRHSSQKFDLVVLNPNNANDHNPLIAIELKFGIARRLEKSAHTSVYHDLAKLNNRKNRVKQAHLIILNSYSLAKSDYRRKIICLYKKLEIYFDKNANASSYLDIKHIDSKTKKIEYFC